MEALMTTGMRIPKSGNTPELNDVLPYRSISGFCFRSFMGMLKKAASGVLAILPCSRTESTLRASK
jgi:hypothetical protein